MDTGVYTPNNGYGGGDINVMKEFYAEFTIKLCLNLINSSFPQVITTIRDCCPGRVYS